MVTVEILDESKENNNPNIENKCDTMVLLNTIIFNIKNN